MSVATKIAEFLAGEADYDPRALLREARAELSSLPGRVMVDNQGVQFGPNCWISHEQITGSADELNRREDMIASQYMIWLDSAKATGESHG